MTKAASAPCTRCGATSETGQREACPECQGIVEPIYDRPAAYGYGSSDDERFVRAWLNERDRPGFASRLGKPYVDWEAWARSIREGWITEEGYPAA